MTREEMLEEALRALDKHARDGDEFRNVDEYHASEIAKKVEAVLAADGMAIALADGLAQENYRAAVDAEYEEKLALAAERCAKLENDAAEAVKAERERSSAKDVALFKINCVRNSILGTGAISWTDHIRPLVEALEEAGYPGVSVDDARQTTRTMVDLVLAQEREGKRLRAAIREFIDVLCGGSEGEERASRVESAIEFAKQAVMPRPIPPLHGNEATAGTA